MGFFSQIGDDLKKIAEPWTIKKSDITNAHGTSLFAPLNKAREAFNNTTQIFKNIRQFGLVDGIKKDFDTRWKQGTNWVSENKGLVIGVVIAAVTWGVGSEFAAAGAAADAADAAAVGSDVAAAGEGAAAVEGGVAAGEGAAAAGEGAAVAGDAAAATGDAVSAGAAGETGLDAADAAANAATDASDYAGLSTEDFANSGGVGENLAPGATDATDATSALDPNLDTTGIPEGNTYGGSEAGGDSSFGPDTPSDSNLTPPSDSQPGFLSKAGDFLTSKTGNTLETGALGMVGNALKGAGQASQQQKMLDAQMAQYTYNANQWHDPNQVAKLKASVGAGAGPNVANGYLTRAQQVSDFLNNSQYRLGAPGAPATVYGTDVKGA